MYEMYSYIKRPVGLHLESLRVMTPSPPHPVIHLVSLMLLWTFSMSIAHCMVQYYLFGEYADEHIRSYIYMYLHSVPCLH